MYWEDLQSAEDDMCCGLRCINCSLNQPDQNVPEKIAHVGSFRS